MHSKTKDWVVDVLINYDVERINSILCDFYNATGTRLDLYSNSFEPISTGQLGMCDFCKYVQKDSDCKKICSSFDNMLMHKCSESMRPERDICPFGLMNVVAPIIYNGESLGYFFFGQMKTISHFSEPESIFMKYSLDKASLKMHYTSLPLFELELIKSISNLAEIVLKHLLTENLLKFDYDETLQKALLYIDANIDKNLSIKAISKGINVSKSALYSKFHTLLNCTIGDYVNRKRIERSTHLLTETNMSIEEVSQKTGFSSASYYTKIFKQHMGITPLKYKKSQSTK